VLDYFTKESDKKMNESFIIKAAELSSSAFMLIIVLILTSKMYNIFTQTTEKLDKITTELSDSNKQLSNQLTKCIMMQENVLNTLKDTMTSTEDTYIHIINLENKIDNTYNKVNKIAIDVVDSNMKIELLKDKMNKL
jgi:uncharacterized coiled-coil protein SlyX